MFDFSKLVVIGDSNADTGNMLRLSDGASPAPFSFNGRYCDGPIWSDILSDLFNFHQVNLAYGGATINNDNIARNIKAPDGSIVQVPGAKQQILKYISQADLPSERKNNEKTLYSLFVGSNDFTSEIKPDAFLINNKLQIPEMAKQVLDCVELLVNELDAKHIIVFGLRPREDYPGIRLVLDKTQIESIRVSVLEFNAELQRLLQEFSKKRNSGNVFYYNIYKSMKQAFINPTKFGISANVDSTVSDVLKTQKTLDEKLMFWDSFHLSTRPHQIIAGDIIRLLAHNQRDVKL
ncbi:hypothetical protein BB559_004520 [Furculomyces boomerangus]|uniref:SGNH hydrolase-type esterase domain-containing protein n=1 Tax=Furculomyces boomerangus TaxID=61424 RepID=A0A2T9YE58_9FUNG|nr:hypothetical protein BB559_004520 [Furculomyces boomerangus]